MRFFLQRVKQMSKYILIAAMAVVVFAYIIGGRVATQKCDIKIAEINASKQLTINKKIGEINEKTFNTGVHDIRNILRAKYTISE